MSVQLQRTHGLTALDCELLGFEIAARRASTRDRRFGLLPRRLHCCYAPRSKPRSAKRAGPWCDPPADRRAGQDVLGAYDLSRFFGITITMYFDDHDPPHFHARHTAGEAKVEIESLEVMDSTLQRRHLRFVLAWAELHQDALLANWQRARAGETLQDIEPLR
jgi:hypothetical protein